VPDAETVWISHRHHCNIDTHVTPVLSQLHWLPCDRDKELMYKSLHGLTPPYLSDDCRLVTEVGRRHLRSSDVYACAVPRTQSQISDRSFTAAGPRLWNNLPVERRERKISFEQFKRTEDVSVRLRLRRVAICLCLTAPVTCTLTYLLVRRRSVAPPVQ